MRCATSPAATAAGSARPRWALLAAAHAVNAALIAGVHRSDLGAVGDAAGADACRRCCFPMLLWYRSLRRRTVPIERYFDVAVRRPAVARAGARRSATRWPPSARRRGSRTGWRATRRWRARSPSVAVVVVGRRLCGLRRRDGRAPAGRERAHAAGDGALRDAAAARRAAPAARAAGRAPPPARRPRCARRSRCAPSWCSSSPASPCSRRGWCCCSRCRPRHALSIMLGSIALALALALGPGAAASCATW